MLLSPKVVYGLVPTNLRHLKKRQVILLQHLNYMLCVAAYLITAAIIAIIEGCLFHVASIVFSIQPVKGSFQHMLLGWLLGSSKELPLI